MLFIIIIIIIVILHEEVYWLLCKTRQDIVSVLSSRPIMDEGRSIRSYVRSCCQRRRTARMALSVKVKVHTLDIAPLRSESPPQKRSGMARVLKGYSQFYLYTHTFIRNRNEPYPPLPSQPQLVLIYRPRRDGSLSRPWCEVAQAEIRTRNLAIANLALYHTAMHSICAVVP